MRPNYSDQEESNFKASNRVHLALTVLLGCALVCITMSSCNEPETCVDNLNEENGLYYLNLKKPYSGFVFSSYDNNQLKERYYINDGVKDGPYVLYNVNGELVKEGAYVKGKLYYNGPNREYYDNGNLYREITLKYGRISMYREYYEEGQLKAEIIYEDGKDISTKLYHIDGKDYYP